MWKCPKCKREFRNANQQHTCKLVNIDDFFKNRDVKLRRLYDKLMKDIRRIGDFRVESVSPNVIFGKTKSTFLMVKVMKDHLVVEFFLEQLENVHPVSKFLQTSKNRWVHCVPVDRAEEIDEQLRGWIARSYALVSG